MIKRISKRQKSRHWQKLIDDGELIDVSYEAYDAGMFHPTAITAKAWDRYVKDCDHAGLEQSKIEFDRLRVILSMLRVHLARGGLHGCPFAFFVPRAPDSISLEVVCNPRDDGRPVFTIKVPAEN